MHPTFSSPYQAKLEALEEEEVEELQEKVATFHDALMVVRELVDKKVDRVNILRLIDRMTK